MAIMITEECINCEHASRNVRIMQFMKVALNGDMLTAPHSKVLIQDKIQATPWMLIRPILHTLRIFIIS